MECYRFSHAVSLKRLAPVLLLLLASCASQQPTQGALNAEDITQIHQLLARYTHLADVDKQHAGEAMREIFTEDATFQVPSIDLYVNGIENIVAFFRDRPGGDHHINTNLVVEGKGDLAKVKSYVHIIKVDGGVQSLVFGYYEDELIKTGRGWRIRLRNVRLLDFSLE